jgi:glycine/D-amino acid oxidase-like deaminating enzyme
VIIGGGVVGAAFACSLARVGLGRVRLYEQGRVAVQGATSRSGGLLRLHHTAQCDTRLAARSLPVFARWDEIIGGDCGYRRTGFVMLASERHGGHLRANRDAAVAAGGDGCMEVIDSKELASLYPGLSVDDATSAAYEPAGGYADPVAACASLVSAATRLGAEVCEGVRVERVLERGGAVTGVETSLGRVSAPLVVLAAGAWGTELAAGLGVRIPLEPRRIGLGQAAVAGAGLPGTASALPTCIDDVNGTYFRPDAGHRVFFGVPCDPAMDLDRGPAPLSSAEVTAAVTAVGRRIPAASAAPLTGTRSGFDGYTPDKRPVVGPGGPDGLYLALGFSGGGFKLAPGTAELAAEEIASGGAVAGKATQDLLAPYRPQRFDLGELIVPEAPYDHM